MSAPDRLLSLDVLRGATIATMIVVNTPGTWSAIYPPLRHAAWHGLTPTDLVFPFFLFIVGVSVALAYGRQLERGVTASSLRWKIAGRALKIFAVGVLLNLWPDFGWAEMRWAGVLQRIALVFLVVGWLFLFLRWRGLVGVTVALLLGYWALLTLVPVPRDAVIDAAVATGQVPRAHNEGVAVQVAERGPAHVAPNVEPGTNLAAWADRHFLPGQLYERTWDPEGWLSTLPSLATALLGVLAGLYVRARGRGTPPALAFAAGGAVLLALGYSWALVFPLNKNLWTSSYVLVSAGWTLVVWAALMVVVDRWGWRRATLPAVVFGANAITAYVLAGLLTVVFLRPWAGRSAAQWLMDGLRGWGASAELASLAFALAYTAVIFLPLYVLYRRRIFLRL